MQIFQKTASRLSADERPLNGGCVQLFKAEFLGVSLSWEPCFPESFLGAWSSSEFPKHSIPREKLFFPSVIVCTFSSLNALAFFGWALHFYVNVMHRSCVPWTVAALSEGHMQVLYVPLPLLLLDKTKTVRRFLILGQLGFSICLDSFSFIASRAAWGWSSMRYSLTLWY